MVGRNPLTVLNEETKREKEMRRGRRRQHHKAVSAPAATYIHIYTQREREPKTHRERRIITVGKSPISLLPHSSRNYNIRASGRQRHSSISAVCLLLRLQAHHHHRLLSVRSRFLPAESLPLTPSTVMAVIRSSCPILYARPLIQDNKQDVVFVDDRVYTRNV